MVQIIRTEERKSGNKVILPAGVDLANGGGLFHIPVSELIPTAEALMNEYQEITGGKIRFRLSAEKVS